MSRKLLIVAVSLLVSSIQPLLADTSDVQVVGASVVNTEITFQVGNSATTPQQVRVQVAVLVADGSTQILTTAPVTVPTDTTATVSVSAVAPITGIIDEPDPISP